LIIQNNNNNKPDPDKIIILPQRASPTLTRNGSSSFLYNKDRNNNKPAPDKMKACAQLHPDPIALLAQLPAN